MLKFHFEERGSRGWDGITKLPKHISAFMWKYGKIVCLYLHFYLQYLNSSKYETKKNKKNTARESHTKRISNKKKHTKYTYVRHKRVKEEEKNTREKCAQCECCLNLCLYYSTYIPFFFHCVCNLCDCAIRLCELLNVLGFRQRKRCICIYMLYTHPLNEIVWLNFIYIWERERGGYVEREKK